MQCFSWIIFQRFLNGDYTASNYMIIDERLIGRNLEGSGGGLRGLNIVGIFQAERQNVMIWRPYTRDVGALGLASTFSVGTPTTLPPTSESLVPARTQGPCLTQSVWTW
jgi:hypothetical protein